MLDVRPATRADAEWLAGHLRAEDHNEVWAAAGESPEVVLPRSFDLSRECYVASWRGSETPCVIFGVADDPTVEGLGVVWLLASDTVHRNPLAVIRRAYGWLDYMSRLYPLGLHNCAVEWNTLHIRWCLLTGFRVIQTLPINGQPFTHIYRETRHVPPDRDYRCIPGDPDGKRHRPAPGAEQTGRPDQGQRPEGPQAPAG